MGKNLMSIGLISCLFLLPGLMNFLPDGEGLNSSGLTDVEDIYMSVANENDEWEKIFGGSDYDSAHHVEETSDGGYILVGSTQSYAEYGYEDIWLIKTDKAGNRLWDRAYGGADLDQGLCVQETKDKGFIITGVTYSYSSSTPHDKKNILIRTDEFGHKLWTKILGQGAGYCVQETDDGGFVVVGYTTAYGASYNVHLIKTDEHGDESWNKTFDSGGFDAGNHVCQTDDGGYILVGSTDKNDGGLWLIKTDSDGNLLWDKVFGRGTDWGHCVQETSDGCFIVAGRTYHYGMGSEDAWLIKTDSKGDELWNHTFGGSGYDWANYVRVTSDGGYILVGGTGSFNRYGSNDVWLIKTDADGNKQWGRILGGTDAENSYCVQETSDDSYVIVGWTKSFGEGEEDIWLVKVVPDNNPPSKPVITGPSRGKIYKPHKYTVSAVDPEDDDIYYFIIWGDSTSGWMGPYTSGEEVTFSHMWSSEGDYTVQVKAIDDHGWDSLLSNPLPVTMPKNKNELFGLLVQRIFHTYPWLFSLIQPFYE